jgi:predicted MFS family arabinose efflux permease
VAGVFPLLGILFLLPVRRTEAAETRASGGMRLTSRVREIVVPAIGFSLYATTQGALFALAALALPLDGLGSAASFFLFAGIARTIVRWLTAKPAEHGNTKLMAFVGLAAASATLAYFALVRGQEILVIASILYGATNGVLQNCSYVGMLKQAGREDYSTVGAIWLFAFDGGIAVGGLTLGWIAGQYGFDTAFWIMPLLPVAGFITILFARWERRPLPITR